jgi:hypothetical protein
MCSVLLPSQRIVMCRPVITSSNLPSPGVPKIAMFWLVPQPLPPLSSFSCLSTLACHSGLMIPS